jgi:hypothetical protein
VLSHAEKHLPPDEKPLFIIESTGCYHQLSVKTFNDATEVVVVNPHRIKAILRADGKDDVKDAVTLTKLVLSFDLKKSVLAVGAQKRLRKVLRMKRKLLDNRTQVSNRIGSLLTENSVPLPNVVKVMTISGRAICNAIAQGQTNRDLLMCTKSVNQSSRIERTKVMLGRGTAFVEPREEGGQIGGGLTELSTDVEVIQ